MADGRGLHISNHFLIAYFPSVINNYILTSLDLFIEENRDLVMTAGVTAIWLKSHRSSNFQKMSRTSRTSLVGILGKF